jgi:osmotically-inducible protein OsmY
VDSEDVDVHVNDGRVTLTGTVDSLLEYRAANRNAFDGGAVLVRNELKIR